MTFSNQTSFKWKHHVVIITLGILGQTYRQDRDEQFERKTGYDSDEEIDEQAEFEIAKVDTSGVALPADLTAVIQFGYDQGLKDELVKENKDFMDYITDVATHTQAYYYHPSLGTKITFKVC